MEFVKYRKYYYSISLVLVVLSILSLAALGLPLGIDFKGGSLLEVSFEDEVPTLDALHAAVLAGGIENAKIQPIGDNGILIRARSMSEDEHQLLISSLKQSVLEEGQITEKRFESIGPVIGKELSRRAIAALALALISILTYISWAFRKVSHVFSSWKYGAAALVALTHDIIIPAGIFSFLGFYKGIEMDALFITALLTILGFSIHDTIVVFDRVRENLKKFKNMRFSNIVEKSIKDTITRSINTSATTLLVLLTVFFFGGSSVHYFSLALAMGIFFGTYSSIFIASPLLVTIYGHGKTSKP